MVSGLSEVLREGLSSREHDLTVFNRDRSLERRLVASGTRLLVDERGELEPEPER